MYIQTAAQKLPRTSQEAQLACTLVGVLQSRSSLSVSAPTMMLLLCAR